MNGDVLCLKHPILILGGPIIVVNTKPYSSYRIALLLVVLDLGPALHQKDQASRLPTRNECAVTGLGAWGLGFRFRV